MPITEDIMARMDYQVEKKDTMDLEASQENSEAIMEQQDIPKEGTMVETIGALED
jgi:hypothetical protein